MLFVYELWELEDRLFVVGKRMLYAHALQICGT